MLPLGKALLFFLHNVELKTKMSTKIHNPYFLLQKVQTTDFLQRHQLLYYMFYSRQDHVVMDGAYHASAHCLCFNS